MRPGEGTASASIRQPRVGSDVRRRLGHATSLLGASCMCMCMCACRANAVCMPCAFRVCLYCMQCMCPRACSDIGACRSMAELCHLWSAGTDGPQRSRLCRRQASEASAWPCCRRPARRGRRPKPSAELQGLQRLQLQLQRLQPQLQLRPHPSCSDGMVKGAEAWSRGTERCS